MLPEGEEGELVFTTLVKEAMPFLRYRTGDIGSLTFEPCRCGRTTARIRGLRGRRDDMIIVRGVNVYPSNVEHALLSVPEAAPHYQLVVERAGAMDELTVQCEPAAPSVDRATYAAAVEHVLREQLGIRVRAEVLEPGACREARERPYASSIGADESNFRAGHLRLDHPPRQPCTKEFLRSHRSVWTINSLRREVHRCSRLTLPRLRSLTGVPTARTGRGGRVSRWPLRSRLATDVFTYRCC